MTKSHNHRDEKHRRPPGRPKSSWKECKVCHGLAMYSYVGAVVCAPCKMFFKRHAENRQVRKILEVGFDRVNLVRLTFPRIQL